MDETNHQSTEPTGDTSNTTNQTTKSEAVDIEQLSNSIAQKLASQADVLKKLATEPTSVNAEGLKHLGEQAVSLSESVNSLKNAIVESQNSIKSELSVIVEDYNKTKFENAKTKAVKQYNLPEEIAAFLDEVSIDKIDSVAQNLANAYAKTGIPAKLGSTKTSTGKEIPQHLQHLLK